MRLVPDRVHARLYVYLHTQHATRTHTGPTDLGAPIWATSDVAVSAGETRVEQWVVVQCESGEDLYRLHKEWVQQCHWHLQRLRQPRAGIYDSHVLSQLVLDCVHLILL